MVCTWNDSSLERESRVLMMYDSTSFFAAALAFRTFSCLSSSRLRETAAAIWIL